MYGQCEGEHWICYFLIRKLRKKQQLRHLKTAYLKQVQDAKMVRAFDMSSLRNTILEDKRMKSADDVDDADKRSSTGTNEAFDKQCVHQKPLLTSESRSSLEKSSKSYCSPNHMIVDDRLESARAEIGQVREENERLKSMLSQIVKEYQFLQQQFFEVVQEEKVEMEPSQNKLLLPHNQENNEEAEPLSLTLGLSLSRLKTDGERRNILTVQSESAKNGNSDLKRESSPDLCNGKIMSCNYESLKDTNKGEISRTWRPSKLLKTMRSDDEQVLERSHLKKARVCVRVRCDAPTMEDGCHWRKYGQKIAKGNPCPRAYYRCTVSPSCPVRKQVQRCAEDMSVLITTYEGNHNHPLPISATAMASATSAATSIVQCRSSASQQQPHHHHGHRSSPSAGPASATSIGGFFGLDFTGNRNPKLPQLYFSNSSLISTCNSHPTVTLGLSSKPDFCNHKELPATFLSFSSSPSSSALSSHLETTIQKSSSGIAPGVLNRGIPSQHLFYQPLLCSVANSQASHPQSLADKLGSEATKGISSNSSVESALAAAMTSFVGDRATSFLGDKLMEGSFGLNLKLGDEQATQIKSLQPSTRADGIPYASSNHMDKPMALSSQQVPKSSTWFPHSSVALSTSMKSACASIPPAETKDHLINFLANSQI